MNPIQGVFSSFFRVDKKPSCHEDKAEEIISDESILEKDLGEISERINYSFRVSFYRMDGDASDCGHTCGTFIAKDLEGRVVEQYHIGFWPDAPDFLLPFSFWIPFPGHATKSLEEEIELEGGHHPDCTYEIPISDEKTAFQVRERLEKARREVEEGSHTFCLFTKFNFLRPLRAMSGEYSTRVFTANPFSGNAMPEDDDSPMARMRRLDKTRTGNCTSVIRRILKPVFPFSPGTVLADSPEGFEKKIRDYKSSRVIE